jgi:hypothetical protein
MDLSVRELRVLTQACLAPALWPWAIVLAEDGLAAAVEACRVRDLPHSTFVKLSEGGWKGREIIALPSHDDVLELILAVRIKAKMARTNKHPKGLSQRDAAHALNVGVPQANDAMRTLERLAGPATRDKIGGAVW